MFACPELELLIVQTQQKKNPVAFTLCNFANYIRYNKTF